MSSAEIVPIPKPCVQLTTQEGYDRWAAIYDSDGNPLIALEEPQVDAALGNVNDRSVLDVGCGTGRHALRLAAAGANVDAIDFSEGMLAKARMKPGSEKVRFQAHDLAQPLPFPAGHFDFVLCGLVVDHISDLRGLFSEMGRVCKPDGKVVIGGSFLTVAGTSRIKLARLNANGTLDTTFDHGGVGLGPGTAPEITKVLAVANGKTIVSGSFLTFNGVTKNRLARLNPNGKIDPTFLSGQGAQAPSGLTIRALVNHPDGSILIAGQFSIFNVSPRTGLAKFRNASDTYGDFDGDGKTDFAIGRRPGSIGQWTWWIVNSSNDSTSVLDFGLSPSDEFQPGDFDGDGKDDIAVYRKFPGTGDPAYYIINSGTNTLKIIPFGQPGDTPLTEDYDGDGKDDLSVWRAPASGQTGPATWFYVASSNNPNNNITYVPWGVRYGTQSNQVDEPYPGDFDGDGKADFRVQRRADTTVSSSNTAAIFYTLSATGQVTYDYFGWASDRVVPGDYDGDGKTDLAVSRGFNSAPSTTTWYIRYTDGRPDEAIAWGAGSLDLFAQGDYDGDGVTDLGVYRLAGEFNFYVRRSTDGQMMVYHLGDSNNCIPIVNYNNR